MSRSKDSLTSFLVGMLLGIIHGILFGILFSPKAGAQINRDVNRFITTLPEQLQQDPPGKLAFIKRTRIELEDRVNHLRKYLEAGRQAKAKSREDAEIGYDNAQSGQ